MNIESLIKDAYLSIKFEPGELSFLASTSKIELPIRDRLSWELQRLLPEKFDVVREWKRTDIAILRDGQPKALIELKAMYSFDAFLENLKMYVNAIEKDEIKARALGCKLGVANVPVYTILLAANPMSKSASDVKTFFKYSGYMKKSLKAKTAAEIADKANECVTEQFRAPGKRREVFRNQQLTDKGSSFGVPFNIQAWCFEYQL